MLQENLLVFNTSLTTTSANNIIAIKKMQLSMTTISKLVEKVVLLFNNKIDYLIFNKDIKKLGELSDIKIKKKQAVENNSYNEKISSIESQIAELNDKISEEELFNEETNSRILEKKESLNSNLSKLDIIMR